MIRRFGLAGLLILGLGLAWTLGGFAGVPQDGPKELEPAAQDKEPPLKKLDPKEIEPGKDQAKPKKDEKKTDQPLQPGNPKDQPKPKFGPPAKPLKAQGDAEDPKEIIARITKNMETVEEHLKKAKAGADTQALQKKIIDDLKKLMDQQQKNKSDADNQKNKPSPQQQDKNNQDKNNQPNPSPQQKPDPQQKPGDPKTQQPASVKQKPDKDKKDQGGALTKNDTNKKDNKDKKDIKTADNTISGLVKDVWGHLPKNKRQEMDAYSHEQFMPQYEQLLRQYYQTIAAKAKNKEGE